MSHERLKLYHQLQQVKRTRTVMKLINTVRDELHQDACRLLKQVTDIARVIGIDDLAREMQRAIAQMEREKCG